MRLPLAMGAVVDGDDCACQTPDSGQVSPVRAVVPIALRFSMYVIDFPSTETLPCAASIQRRNFVASC
jgi:hypothetical protein